MAYGIISETIAAITGIPKDEILQESHLMNELDVDSLDMAQITLAVENHFKIDITDAESAEIETVQDLVDVVESRLGNLK